MIHIYDNAPRKLHMPGTFCRAYHVLMPRIRASRKTGTEVEFELEDLEEPTIEDMEYLEYFDGDHPNTPPKKTWVLGKSIWFFLPTSMLMPSIRRRGAESARCLWRERQAQGGRE